MNSHQPLQEELEIVIPPSTEETTTEEPQTATPAIVTRSACVSNDTLEAIGILLVLIGAGVCAFTFGCLMFGRKPILPSNNARELFVNQTVTGEDCEVLQFNPDIIHSVVSCPGNGTEQLTSIKEIQHLFRAYINTNITPEMNKNFLINLFGLLLAIGSPLVGGLVTGLIFHMVRGLYLLTQHIQTRLAHSETSSTANIAAGLAITSAEELATTEESNRLPTADTDAMLPANAEITAPPSATVETAPLKRVCNIL